MTLHKAYEFFGPLKVKVLSGPSWAAQVKLDGQVTIASTDTR